MSTTTPPDLSTAPAWAWAQILDRTCLAYSQGYDHGYSLGYAAAQADATQGAVNRQISRAGVANISTEIARAKADGREPRLYAGGAR